MLGEALSVASALLMAGSTIVSAKALKYIDPLSANTLKTLFSAVSMIPIAFAMGEIPTVSNLDVYGLSLVILAAIIGFGVGDTCLFKSITIIGVSKSYMIAFTFPLFSMFFSNLFLGEPFLLKYLIGALIIFFGIVNILVYKNSKDTKESSKGLLAAFAAAILWSLGTVLVALGIRSISIISANAIRYPFLFLFMLPISRPWRKKLNLNKGNLALLAASGILSMTLGAVAFLFGIQFIGVSRAAPLHSSSPVWASLMSIFLLREKVTWRVITSSLLVVAGIYFLT